MVGSIWNLECPLVSPGPPSSIFLSAGVLSECCAFETPLVNQNIRTLRRLKALISQWHKVWKGQPNFFWPGATWVPGEWLLLCTAGLPAVGKRGAAHGHRKKEGTRSQGRPRRDTAPGRKLEAPRQEQTDGQTDRQESTERDGKGTRGGSGAGEGSSCPVGPGQASCKSLGGVVATPLCDEAGAFQLTHEGHQPWLWLRWVSQ